MKEIINIFAYRDLANNCTVDLDGRHHLKSDCIYVFNVSLNIKSLVLTGDVELRSKPKSVVTITLTSPGISISSYNLNLLTIRNLKIKSKSKISLFDLRGAVTRISNCAIRAKRLGRIDLESLSLHDIVFNGFKQGFTAFRLTKLTAKYLIGNELTGALMDLSSNRDQCKVTMKKVHLREDLGGHFELIRVETKTDENLYQSPNISDPSLFELENVEINVTSVNTYKTILNPRDKVITGYCYNDKGDYLYQPFRFTNKIDLSSVSARSIYG